MNYNVFDTQEEADTAQEACFQAWKASHPATTGYWSNTTSWNLPKQRLDGKWVYAVCPEGDQGHSQETYDPSWFADPQA